MGVVEMNIDNVAYLTRCKRERSLMNINIKAHDVIIKVMPVYLCRQARAAAVEKIKSMDSLAFFRKFTRYMIKTIISRMNRGSVQARIQTWING
jgi:hypothetical protein